MKTDIKINNAIFIVTKERSCPYYDLGDELKVETGTLSISSFKPACLILAGEIKKVVTEQDKISRFSRLGSPQLRSNAQHSQFDCGGCTGLIHYQFKQDKEYVTLQMKLLMESEDKRKRQHIEKYYNLIRPLKIFDSLENDSLKDLINLLEFKTILPQKILLEKGSPGTHLYIIMSGEVDEVEGSGQKISRMHSEEIFGEKSLLSSEPHSSSFHTVTDTQIALLSIKNFRQILNKHPHLQIFLFKLLIDRVQAMALRSGNIASGMTGDLGEVPAIDLMQLINSSQKTGQIEITSVDGKAEVYFNEGDIIYAQYNQIAGKEAVFAILGIKNGQFSYNRGIVDQYKNLSPIGDFMGLMMEGLQKIDEQHNQH